MEKYLIDSCIFLEILLKQEKCELCKKYLEKRIGNIFISDFSLHSTGIILFNLNKAKDYNIFLEDVLPKVELVPLPVTEYFKIIKIQLKYNLDFDDSYQTAVANSFGLTISTLDKDFRKIQNAHRIEFVK